jgi:glycosyltransferase 2 family protein
LITENALIWLIFSVGFHLMINSFYPVYMSQTLIIIGTYSISWLVGYYTFFFPGGLGVQEGIQVYLLTFFFPLPISIVIALASRVWLILGDTIVFLLAVVVTMHENRLQRSAHGA